MLPKVLLCTPEIEREERVDVAVDDRQIVHLRRLDGAAYGAVFEIDGRGLLGDGDGFGGSSGGQGGVDVSLLVDSEGNVGLEELLEALRVDGHGVGSDGQEVDAVVAAGVGGDGVGVVGVCVDDGDFRAGHDGSGGVSDGADECGGGELRVECGCE